MKYQIRIEGELEQEWADWFEGPAVGKAGARRRDRAIGRIGGAVRSFGTTQEVAMKSRDVLRVAGPADVLIAIALLSSCTTTKLASNPTGWSDYATIAIKDYAVVGIVRVVSQEVTQLGFLGIANSHTGSQVTYDLLISEAKRLGADDIINVRIDRTDESLHGIFDRLVGYTEKHAYTANVRAIKYTGRCGILRPGCQRPLRQGRRDRAYHVGRLAKAC